MTRRRRIAALAVLLAGLGGAVLGARLLTDDPVPIPKLRPPRITAEDEVILATFPPRWSVGQSWVLEVEEDFYDMDYRIVPGRYFASMRLVAVLPERVVVEWDMVNEQSPNPQYLVVGLEPFQLRRKRVPNVPREWTTDALVDARMWSDEIGEPTTVGCIERPPPWHIPFGQKHHFLGRELVGARLWSRGVGDATQSASILGRSGILFTIEAPHYGAPRSLRLHWRRGEPWWSKVECVPADGQNAPARGRGLTTRRRPLRARLIAVDERPVEVVAWEHAPADWFAGAAVGVERPVDAPPFDAYRARRDARNERWTDGVSTGAASGGPAPPAPSPSPSAP